MRCETVYIGALGGGISVGSSLGREWCNIMSCRVIRSVCLRVRVYVWEGGDRVAV
eukprot:m.61222 g.61222  ORF g.61222 m.61222 type:complete len:55 (+) comp22950_c0_seq1:46-210(+)